MNISVGEWILGGHSLGAAAATAVFTATGFPSDIRRVVQWAVAGDVGVLRRAQNDCAANNEASSAVRLGSLLRIYGTRDRLVTPHGNDATPSGSPDKPGNLSTRTRSFHSEIEMIVGGNHSGFAHYGPQFFPQKDLERVGITLDEQQAKVVKWTADFILEKNKH
eukprot:jgi/Psemu1/310187/fgenesh1_kg.603_\